MAVNPGPQALNSAVRGVGDVEGDSGKHQQGQQEAKHNESEFDNRTHAHTPHAACGTVFRQVPMVAA